MHRRLNLHSAVPTPAVRQAAVWIRTQRERLRPRARPLSAAERAAFAPHLPAIVLRSARIIVVPSVTRPPAAGAPRDLRLNRLLDFADLQAITFADTIAMSRAGMPPPEQVMPLLFHELVHVVQYRQLGVVRFVRRYLEGWAASGHDYGRIPLERQAFDLEKRLARRPHRSIPVDTLVRQLAGSDRPARAGRRCPTMC